MTSEVSSAGRRRTPLPHYPSPIAHYANAFTIHPGRCFRMVQLPSVGQPFHCPEPVTTSGRWRDAGMVLHRVDACEAHRGELVAPISPARTGRR